MALPLLGKILAAKTPSSVDLPAPFGPRITHRSPVEIRSESGPKI
jgi:hypothetical protein